VGRVADEDHSAVVMPPQVNVPVSGVDELVEVATEDADLTARDLARSHGLLVGWSAGAAVWAARLIARREPGAVVVVIGCDTGSRYLSVPHRWNVR
jgi:cysteine synthase A